MLGWLRGGGEMGERIRAFDWSATPLGPLERWSPGVRNVVNLMLDARQSAYIAWGPDLALLYYTATVRATEATAAAAHAQAERGSAAARQG